MNKGSHLWLPALVKEKVFTKYISIFYLSLFGFP